MYLVWFAVIVPGAVAQPGLTASGDRFDLRFLSMQSTTPKQIAAPNRRLRLGLMPWSFRTLISQGSGVGELVRRRPRGRERKAYLSCRGEIFLTAYLR